MSNINFIYDYKHNTKKNGNSFVSIRDKGENSLLEVVKKGNQVEFITNWRSDKTTKFTMPSELFEKMCKDIIQNNNE
ncbi:hypothetical protein [Bacillus sp. EAC]|uniref:hypothetical protein n=1 Tax=Bacillus sp. EAC TaxID=1978338 RepID=UPI00277D0C72|nr:hypothetical protein [Bacillus sp. EAC]